MGMNQMIVLQKEWEAFDVSEAAREPAPDVMEAAPTTLFEGIDQAISAVFAQSDRWCARDEREGSDGAHFVDYVRWRIAIIDDAAAQARALLGAESLTAGGSPWLAAHARA